MTLTEWLRSAYTRVELEASTQEYRSLKLKLKNETNRALTLGLLSTNSKEEWTIIVKNIALKQFPDIVIDEIPNDYYEEKLILMRNHLTKLLFDGKNSRIIEQYLKILERRDKERWSDKVEKKTQVTATSNDINLKFEIVE